MSPTSNLVLALDPGFDRLGLAVLEKVGGQELVHHSACLTSNKRATFAERLLELGNSLEAIIKEWQPTTIALEKLFFSTNRKTASQVAEVRGLILYLAAKHHCLTREFSPQEVKLTVTGYGQASKDQVKTMVSKLVKLPTRARHDDEYDAIAIGLATLSTLPT